jgi:hypothetical protein
MKSNAFSITTVLIVLCAALALTGCEALVMVNTNLEEPDGIPGEVRSLAAAPGAGIVRLTWTDPTEEDFDHAEVNYSAGNEPAVELPSVAKGVQQITVESLEYGTVYVFTVKLVDLNGNKSLGSVIMVSLNRVVDDLNLAQYLTAPVAGVLPDFSNISGLQYTGTVTWRRMTSPTSGVIVTGSYEAGEAYRVMLNLTARPGYTLAGLQADSFIYAGATSPTPTFDEYGRVIIDFPVLDETWYVADYGNDAADGRTRTTALQSVETALVKIAAAHLAAKSLAATAPNGLTGATIVVIGISSDTKTILIDNLNTAHSLTKYPPITLRGLSPSQPGILTADKVTSPPWSTGYRVLQIQNGAHVTLGNDITITGGGQRADTGAAGVWLHANSTLTMNGGVITGNKTTNGGGGGILVADNSTFTMNGGIISDNTATIGGGVGVSAPANVIMNGGLITRNTGTSSGAGLTFAAGTTFTMTGGTISDNIADTLGAGGVNMAGNFTMSGGAITGNRAVQSGGGVNVWSGGTFILTSGTITGNTSGMAGGGVILAVDGGSFTMRGGIIAGNTAAAGGGVAVVGGTFIKAPVTIGQASGIIYGSNGGSDSNTATFAETLLQDKGHAVYITTGPKIRETTAGQADLLDSGVGGASGGWVE